MQSRRPIPLRISIVFFPFVFGVAVLAGRLYHIQIHNHSFLLGLAMEQSQTSVELAAMRGSILDRNGVPLAVSLKTPAVYADPGLVAVPGRVQKWLPAVLGISPAVFSRFANTLSRLPEDRVLLKDLSDPTLPGLERLTVRLASHIGVPAEGLIARLHKAAAALQEDAARKVAPILGLSEAEVLGALQRDRRFVWLKRPVDEATAGAIEALKVRGIAVLQEPRREVLKGLQIGQWLGFVGAEGHGLEGLELYFDRELTGTSGLAVLAKDGRGHRIADAAEPTAPARHGATLHLTIDTRIQAIIDEELQKVFEEFSPVSASAIVMEPDTGRILALGSVPGLDIGMLEGMSQGERERRLRNHPVQSVYEPGSTFKPFVVAAALELGILTPTTMIHCENGCWRYRSRTLHDHSPYGLLPVIDVIALSSNIGMAKIGIMLGDQRLRQWVLRFGFGRRLGVMLPAEEPGIITPASRWNYFTTTSVPLGQEVACSPLQLITGFCSLVNGGRLMQPYLVEGMENTVTGEMTRRTPLEIARVISPATSEKMRHIMAAVVDRGTAKAIRDSKYPIGGKTGTSQVPEADGTYSHDKFVASFAGFAPVENPRICVLVMVDQPKGARYYGGQVSAPPVGRIIDKTLTVLDLAPEPAICGPAVAAARR